MSLVISFYRLSNFFYKINLRFLGRIISLFTRLIFSTWIPGSATIGKNFTIGYGGLGVVIHSDTIIGNNCQVNQNVTIGRNFGDTKVPIIGNDVYIGAGSVVFGEITIGNNVIIGSNSLINKSVPDNCTVVGNPMKIIETNRVKKYYELDRPNLKLSKFKSIIE